MTSSLKSRFDRLPRRTILLGSDKLAVYHWLKGRITNSYLFDADEIGQEQFDRYLQQVQSLPTYVVTDLAEEEFRQETIPHVFGADRKAVIQRKQNRLFRDATYSYSQIQGREKEGRRDDRVLLTSITKPGLLKPWLEILERNRVPVAGVTSVAIFFQEILQQLPEPANNMLVVSLQSISGLRQSFFSNGELKISRSIKMPRFGSTSYAPFISQEIEKIRRYLSSLRFIVSDEPLDVYFLTHGAMLDELQRELIDSETQRYHLIDLQQIADESGSGLQLNSPFCDPLLAWQVLNKKPDNHYAKDKDVRYFTMRKMRHGLYAASALILLAGFIYSGVTMMQAVDYKQQSLAAEKKTQFYNERYELARAGLPDTPVEPADLQVLAKIADDLKKYKTTPLPMLKVISRGLEEFPTVILDKLSWGQVNDPTREPGEVKRTNQVNPYQTQPVALPAPGLALADSEKPLYYHVATLNAHLSDFDGNYRRAIATINSFAESIRQKKGVTNVTVTSLPLNISSDTSLQGATGTSEKEALFTMKVALGVKANEPG